MSNGTNRAFAQKLNRQSASDVRRQVSTYVAREFPRSVSGSSFGGISVSSVDSTGAPEYEELLDQSRAAIERDPLRSILLFPDDDLEVKAIPRQCRTVKPLVPEPGADSDPRVRDCVRVYTSDHTYVHRRYEVYSAQHLERDPSEEGRRVLRETTELQYEVDLEASRPRDSKTPQRSSSFTSNSSDTPRGSWSSSNVDLKNSQPDCLLPRLLEPAPLEEVDSSNRALRALERQPNLFVLCPPHDEEEFIERRLPAEKPSEQFGYRIMVKCSKLRFDLEVEPIFASMAIYDAREKKKISENFYFDLNPEPLKGKLSAHIPYQNVSTLSRTAVFSITYPSPDVFLVIKLEKVLQQGDVSEVAEPYMKVLDDRSREKVGALADEYCDRLGQYRMPFAWTAVYLTNVLTGGAKEAETPTGTLERRPKSQRDDSPLMRRGSFQRTSLERGHSWASYTSQLSQSSDTSASSTGFDNFTAVTLTVSSFFKQESEKLGEEDLYRFLTDLKKPTSLLKRLKCIPGELCLDVCPCPLDLTNCLSPELQPLVPFPDSHNRPAKEVLEFPSRETYAPWTMYRNLLYVNPRNVNLSGRQGSGRNVAVKVQYMAGEEENHALPIIFGKSSCPEYSKEAYTSVIYHNKCPSYYEEVKMRLPGKLQDTHHLLFTFYHVSCQRKYDAGPTETPIGYTWLPVYQNGRLTVGEFNLPVCLDKPPNYSVVSPLVNVPFRWMENHKPLFSVSIEAVSSIHTLDEHVDNFLSLCSAGEEQRIPTRIGEQHYESELRKSVANLRLASVEARTRFSTLLLNKLLLLLVQPPVISGQAVNIAPGAFEALAQLVHVVHSFLNESNDAQGRNALLTSYIQYSCRLPHPSMGQGDQSYLYMCDTPTSGQNARPGSLPTQPHPIGRSTSNPDLSPGADPYRFERSDSLRIAGQQQGRGGEVGRTNSGSSSSKTRRLVHEEFALQLVVVTGETRRLVLPHAWFMLSLITKSMAEHLAWQGLLTAPRKARFPQAFLDDLTSLVNALTRDVTERASAEDGEMARCINMALAFFLLDLLSLVDRGAIMGLIRNYLRALSAAPGDAMRRQGLRVDLLRIVCSHEHFVALNFPVAVPVAPTSPSSASQLSLHSSSSTLSFASSVQASESRQWHSVLTAEYCKQHFLAGLVLTELKTALTEPGISSVVQTKAINMMRATLRSHDSDPRYATPEARGRLARMYLPLIDIVCQASDILHLEGRGWKGHGEEEDPYTLDSSVAMAIAGASQYTRQKPPEPTGAFTAKRTGLSYPATRGLLSCLVWVLKHCEPRLLVMCWVDSSPSAILTLLHALHATVEAFQYKGRLHIAYQSHTLVRKSSEAKSKLEAAILGTSNSRSELMRRRLTQPLDLELPGHKSQEVTSSGRAGSIPPEIPPKRKSVQSQGAGSDRSSVGSTTPTQEGGKLRWRKDQTSWRQQLDSEPMLEDRGGLDRDTAASLDSYLAHEAALVVLDALELIIQVMSSNDALITLMGSALSVLLHLMSANQSTAVLHCLFASQRAFVTKFPELVFEEEAEACSELCLQLLRHCSSRVGPIRAQAAGSLYLLMRHNFEKGNTFARVKMQVTLALSTLVAQDQSFSEEALRKALKTILTYADQDADLQETTFPQQVQDLVFNLHMILSDTVKMKEHHDDPEMLMDLMYRIAKGYQASPDLRLTWLQNMAESHIKRGNHTEAALCLVHAAGVVAEYLSIIEHQPWLPVGCVSLTHITPNVIEESAVSEDAMTPGEEGMCAGKYFTEHGLVGLLEQAASFFNLAGLYECVNQVYKVLIPIHEHNRDFGKLTSIHAKLQEAFHNIMLQKERRMFGTYFRVGLYGEKFGDLKSEEFIVKEPAITRLPEISHRLESFYTAKFGPGVVEMVKDSNTVEVEILDPEKAYIQITYVEPYFEDYELRHRVTCFERNYNIKTFMYATPFTQSGRAHGELKDQYKRKTVIVTSHAFPYVKTRLQVIRREQFELSPIEVAIEDVMKKTGELTSALNQDLPDRKILQMVLQGCIGTTVNQGPVEVAAVFLSSVADGREQPTQHHNKLRLCFKNFIKKCGDALAKNKDLIFADQAEYQRELERNFRSVRDALTPLIALPGSAAKKKHKHSKERSSKNKSSAASVTSNDSR